MMLLTCIGNISAQTEKDTTKCDPLDNLYISLLTCEPHDEVYSLYGHTAIRIEDRSNGNDWAVNWGVFDSRVSFFVLRFIFGLTDYTVAIYDFRDFLAEYRYYGCAVHQQRLNLDREQKRRFMALLQENVQPENLVYRYNYFYNNCTTKARDIIARSVEDEEVSVEWRNHDDAESSTTLRDLVHKKTEGYPWARWGNDILLGVGSDQHTRDADREFLPEFLMRDMGEATLYNKKTAERMTLVDSTFVVLQAGTPYHAEYVNMPLTPTHCAIILLCAILALIATEILTRRRLYWTAFCLTSVYGIIGIFLFMMLFSQHPTVRVNLQILICNPLMFYLTLPKTQFKYRWEVVLTLSVIFFIGNAIQSYAEGMNIMALALSILAIYRIIKKKV